MAQSTTPQQSGSAINPSPKPQQQQQGQAPAGSQQQGQTVFRDWAAI